MKLACLQQNLCSAIRVLESFLATRNTAPIMNSILLETYQSNLRLVATNLEMTISYVIFARMFPLSINSQV